MKKISMLFAAAIFLYGAPGVYAETEIRPGMSEKEVIAVLQENDIDITVSIPEAVGDEAEDAAESDINDPAGLPKLPKNVSVDDSQPVKGKAMCGYKMTGEQMAQFPVTATFGMPPFSDTAIWQSFINLPGAGAAIGWGWMLFQMGDTWGHTLLNKWFLFVQRPGMTSIEIDPISKTSPKNGNGLIEAGVFDIIKRPEITIGSAKGWPIEEDPLTAIHPFMAVYSHPVGFPTPKGDLYGTLTINFNPALVSQVLQLIDFFIFRADTDCVLAVEEVILNSYDGTTLNFTVVGEGAVVIAEEDGSMVQGPFVVERGDGSADFVTQFTPKADSCYVMTDIDTGTVMTDEYCF